MRTLIEHLEFAFLVDKDDTVLRDASILIAEAFAGPIMTVSLT